MGRFVIKNKDNKYLNTELLGYTKNKNKAETFRTEKNMFYFISVVNSLDNGLHPLDCLLQGVSDRVYFFTN